MIQLSSKDARAFITSKGTKHVGTHVMKEQLLHWRFCSNCGLLNLKNEVTRLAMRKACVWYD